MATDTNHAPVEKDTNGNYNFRGDIDHVDHAEALQRMRTAGSISMSPELFEKLYLSPQNAVKGDLRKTFGNPTPLALIGFLLSLFPLSMDLMGWRSISGTAAGQASIGAYFFCGGLLMILGSVGEWLLGNTFPFVVFGSFGGFWLTFGATLQPANAAVSAYTNPTDFYSSFGFFFIAMGLLCLIYLVCSIRTNVAFFIIFLTLVVAFGALTGAYWQTAAGNAVIAGKLLKVAGAFVFVTCLSGWWIFVAIMLASLDFPFALPVGDLSHIIRGASDRQSAKVNGHKV